MGENPELLAMARRICAETRPDYAEGFLSGKYDNSSTEMQTALAAIIETQERDAALAEDRYLETDWQEPGQCIATAIRSGQHYGKASS